MDREALDRLSREELLDLQLFLLTPAHLGPPGQAEREAAIRRGILGAPSRVRAASVSRKSLDQAPGIP
jgi:hypothetical protein